MLARRGLRVFVFACALFAPGLGWAGETSGNPVRFAFFNIQLGYALGMGTQIGFKLLHG